MLTEILTLIVGVIVVLLLAEIIIKNALQLSKHFGLSGTFIGLTVLSVGTSIPEIMTHIIGSVNILQNPSSMNTLSALLLGTSVGSDIFQQSFILPIIGIIGTIVVVKKNLLSEMGGLIAAALLTWIFSIGGIITRIEGIILLLVYISYIVYLKNSKMSEMPKAENHLSKQGVAFSSIIMLLCFVIMGFIADMVLNAATILLNDIPISASFLGVILLGVASALPELMTSLVAVLKGKKNISAGILIGSNITNPLMGIGLGAIISTYTVPNVFVFYDLPFKIATGCLIFYFLFKGKNLTKKEAFALIGLFLAYIFVRSWLFPVDF